MSAQALVNNGLRWRIGNDEQVRVWGNKLLPTPFTYKGTSPGMFLQAQTQVSDLINKENASWKTEVIDALFLPREAEEIKSIPLGAHLLVDKQIWACSPNGLYTVCNAFWLATEMSKSRSCGSCSNNSQNKRFWRKPWKLLVPHKIRHFTWRACRDILLTKANLVRRHVIKDDKCDGCNLASENSSHCFWTCYHACEMWECSKLVLPFSPDQDYTFKDLLWSLLMEGESSSEKIAKVVTYAWAL